MLRDEQTRRGTTDREIALAYNWVQQTFSKWKMGSLPRDHKFASIASFLGVPVADVRALVEEASQSTGRQKLAAAFGPSRIYGRVSDRKDGKYAFDAFNQGRKRIPEGRYTILIDTKVMEPSLLVGTRAWIDPSVWPRAGHEVLVHAKGGVAWLGRLVSIADRQAEIERLSAADRVTMTIRDVEAVHVIVLSERLAQQRA